MLQILCFELLFLHGALAVARPPEDFEGIGSGDGTVWTTWVDPEEILNEEQEKAIAAKALKESYTKITKDVQDVIDRIMYDVTKEDILISYKLMPLIAPMLDDFWGIDSEILTRSMLNSLTAHLKHARVFIRPDPFDMMSVTRNFFCLHFPCKAGYCALQSQRPSLNVMEVGRKLLDSGWGSPSENFEGMTPVAWIRDVGFTERATADFVIGFWNRLLVEMTLLRDGFAQLTIEPNPDDIKETAGKIVYCVCQPGFTQPFCDPVCDNGFLSPFGEFGTL